MCRRAKKQLLLEEIYQIDFELSFVDDNNILDTPMIAQLSFVGESHVLNNNLLEICFCGTSQRNNFKVLNVSGAKTTWAKQSFPILLVYSKGQILKNLFF